jgi:hypothetical protein
MKNKWNMNTKVINLREVIKEIGGPRWDLHPVYEEWKYQVLNRCKGNDSANLEWVGDEERTPLINKFLLSNGFKKGEEVLYFISW